jgi:hypothetical protein
MKNEEKRLSDQIQDLLPDGWAVEVGGWAIEVYSPEPEKFLIEIPFDTALTAKEIAFHATTLLAT